MKVWRDSERVPEERLLRSLLQGSKPIVTALVVASVLSGTCEAAILGIIAQTADALVSGTRELKVADGPLHFKTTIDGLLIAGFAAIGLRTLLQGALLTLPAKLAADAQASLRNGLTAAYTNASWTAQSRDKEGELQELMTNQTQQASWVTLALTSIITAGLTLLVLVGSAFVLSPVAAVITLGITMTLLGALRPISHLVENRSRLLSHEQLRFAGEVGQMGRTAQDMDVFGVRHEQAGKVREIVAAISRQFFRQQVLAGVNSSLYQTVIYVLLVGGLGVLHALNGGHIAALGAIVLLLVRSGTYGQQVAGSFQGLRQMAPFVEQVRSAERAYAASAPPSGDRELREIREITFDRASFFYTPGAPVLRDVTFAVAGGESIGIIGPSGAGKSTLTQILLRLRPLDAGAYLVNGVAADDFRRSDWNARVAYVPQEPRLLHASVAENIRYLRSIDDDAIERAARLARIHDDIVTWRDGYDTRIGPRADAISGGQQQRICIARALAGQPELLILDEPTSALDPRSERLLQESLAALKERLTLFVIAHRMSTIDICDRVMVIIGGRLEAFDTAARLLEDSSYYRSASGSAVRVPEPGSHGI